MEYDTKNKIYNLGKNHGKFLLYQESEIREVVVAGNLDSLRAGIPLAAADKSRAW